MGRLSKSDRHRAVGLLETGTSTTRVAHILRVTRRTICNLKARIRETGTVDDRPRSGRPAATTEHQDRFGTERTRTFERYTDD